MQIFVCGFMRLTSQPGAFQTRLSVSRRTIFQDSYTAVMAVPVKDSGLCDGLRVLPVIISSSLHLLIFHEYFLGLTVGRDDCTSRLSVSRAWTTADLHGMSTYEYFVCYKIIIAIKYYYNFHHVFGT